MRSVIMSQWRERIQFMTAILQSPTSFLIFQQNNAQVRNQTPSPDANRFQQEAQLPQRDRATRYVSKFVLRFTK